MPGQRHRCAQLAARDSRRHRRQSLHGRNTAAWRRLRKLALERDDHTCQLQVDGGCTGAATSVHLSPELAGDHDAATLDDLTSACAHCHGRLDGQRGAGLQ
jgi:5-methylcytosine-specific restriction endonuclease McrA